MNKSLKKGFTLVEIFVVVGIIAVLLLIAIPKYIDSSKGAKIRVFEVNVKTLISDINKSYMNNNLKTEQIYDDINQIAISFSGKPEHSEYKIDKKTNILICKLKKEVFQGTEDYIIKYDVKTQIITQKPAKLPSGATNMK